jgi:hypothetical protein
VLVFLLVAIYQLFFFDNAAVFRTIYWCNYSDSIFEQFQIVGSDLNVWSSIYATILNDAENIIVEATASGSPHYSGVAKILKGLYLSTCCRYLGYYSYSDTQKLAANVKPKYDTY